MQDAGLGEVGRLLMHSSLHSLGQVDGGAETLIDALLEVLGEEGTLMVPTFNYNLELDVFDPATVRSQTTSPVTASSARMCASFVVT